MNVRLLAFASAAEALGTHETSFEVTAPEGSAPTVSDLKSALSAMYPALTPLWTRMAVSINGTVATDIDNLEPHAEVALLPPVSGG